MHQFASFYRSQTQFLSILLQFYLGTLGNHCQQAYAWSYRPTREMTFIDPTVAIERYLKGPVAFRPRVEFSIVKNSSFFMA